MMNMRLSFSDNIAGKSNRTTLVYVGSIVPDEAKYTNFAFSRAGNMCQLSLLKGFISAGFYDIKVLSLRPVASFPRSRQIIYPAAKILLDSIRLNFLPFINITPIKQLSVGLSALWHIARAAWFKNNNAQQNVIFSYNISVPPGIFALLGARVTGSKAVAMIYDICVPSETAPDNFFNRIDFWLHKKTLPLFDGLIVITDSIANDFAPNRPFLCIEGGISNDLISKYQAIAATAVKDNSCFTIVSVGRLDEINGINEILGAFTLIKDKEFRLHIAGTGPLETTVKRAAANDTRITYHGLLPFDKVLALYMSADVLVNMRLTQQISTRYFFPSKTMEYLASGVPLITTCPGNLAAEYGEFAYLLHNETPQALSQLIKMVAALPEQHRRERARIAQNFMAENKTWDHQAKRITRFLEELTTTSGHCDDSQN
jgi:glycosyltransferase involved in cell wall biosynthesis